MRAHTDPGPPTLVEGVRARDPPVEDAVLGGGGPARGAGAARGGAGGRPRAAERAPEAAGGRVAVVVPRLGACALAPEGTEPEGLRQWVADRVKDRAGNRPGQVLDDVPISSGDEVVGAVVLLRAPEPPGPDAAEFLHLAAVASL